MTGLPGGLTDAIARQLERQMGAGAAAALRRAAAAAARRPRPTRGRAPPLSREAGRLRRSSTPRAARAAEAQSGIPAAFMIGAGGARIGLGPAARSGTPTARSVAQPVRHQGRRRLERPGRRDHDHRVRRRRSRSKVTAKFRAYASYDESFRDYARLMKESPRYAAVVAQARRRRQRRVGAGFAQGLQRAGYATDPAYADKLTRVINTTLRVQRATA